MQITQPTTVPEFRRLANAFLSGSRFPTGTAVLVIMSTRGLRPINRIILADPETAEEEWQAAMENPPLSFSREERDHQVTYRVVVPDVNRLNAILIGGHGATGCTLVRRRANSAPQPDGAVLGSIARSALHVTWTNGDTSIYDLPILTDAVGFTRGAAELFAFSVYQAMYGTDYVEQFRESLSSQSAE